MVRVDGVAPSVLTPASWYSFPLPLRYYACLCGHEELVLYLLANGERGGTRAIGLCVCTCARAIRHVYTYASTPESSPLHPVSKYCQLYFQNLGSALSTADSHPASYSISPWMQCQPLCWSCSCPFYPTCSLFSVTPKWISKNLMGLLKSSVGF